ncbi:MAG: hypothetical protein K6348_09390 [Deferribacterales bacterium]
MLYVAGVPINDDYSGISDDLAKIIKESDFVIGEERKNTLRLLAKVGARGKSFYLLNEHTSYDQLVDIVNKIAEAEKVVFFSDSGTPCVADPGYRFIDLCYERGIKISAIPGPSSITTALSISGFYAEKFYFAGFLPKDRKDFKKFLTDIDMLGVTTVVFERPYGIKNIIEFLKLIKNRRIALIVKIGYEDGFVYRGEALQVYNELINKNFPKSPFVLVIESLR